MAFHDTTYGTIALFVLYWEGYQFFGFGITKTNFMETGEV